MRSLSPDQDDVVHERTPVVGEGRNKHRAHPLAVDRHPSEQPNPLPGIPGRPVDELRVVRERTGRSRENQVLRPYVARPDYPPAPRLRTASGTARADHVETGRPWQTGDGQSSRNPHGTRNRVPDGASSRTTLRTEDTRGGDEGQASDRLGCRTAMGGRRAGAAAEGEGHHQGNDVDAGSAGHAYETTTARHRKVPCARLLLTLVVVVAGRSSSRRYPPVTRSPRSRMSKGIAPRLRSRELGREGVG